MLLGAVLPLAALLSACTSAGAAERSLASDGLPPSPVTERFVRCIQDAGWEAVRDPGGGVDGPTLPAAQVPQYWAASEVCAESSGWNAMGDFSNWSHEQRIELYEQEVAAHECFLSIGIASAEPPSLQQYLDTFHSADQYYAFVPGLDTLWREAFERTVKQCPPPTWFVTVTGFD